MTVRGWCGRRCNMPSRRFQMGIISTMLTVVTARPVTDKGADNDMHPSDWAVSLQVRS